MNFIIIYILQKFRKTDKRYEPTQINSDKKKFYH